MSEQAQVGDTVRISYRNEGVVHNGDGRLFVGGVWLDEPNLIIEILSHADAPLPSNAAATLYDVRAYLAKTLDNFEDDDEGLTGSEVREFIRDCLAFT